MSDGSGGKFKLDSDRTTDCLEWNGNTPGNPPGFGFRLVADSQTHLSKGPYEGAGKQSLSAASCPLQASQNYCYWPVCLVGHILGACQIDGPMLLICSDKMRGINSGCACDFKADFTMLGICAVIRHSGLKGRLLPYSSWMTFYIIRLNERWLCK